jgi:hypothetical protein
VNTDNIKQGGCSVRSGNDSMKVRLHVGHDGATIHKIVLDDVDVSNGFNYCSVEMRAGQLATMTLGAPVIEHGWVGGEVGIQILPETREALILLGWTPPAEEVSDASADEPR